MRKQEHPYYNMDYLSQILNLYKEGKFRKAYERYQIYLENYPNDLTANVNFANLLVKLGYFEEAKNILEKIKSFSNYPGDYFTFIDYIEIEIMCAKGKYEEAYQFYLNHPNLLCGQKNEANLLFLKMKANIPIQENFIKTYLIQQMLNYDEQLFLRHSKDHLEKSAFESDFTFVENFPLEDVINQIKQLIPNAKRIYNSIHGDQYFFKYNHCGFRKDRNTDYLIAIAFRDTSNLITMYPISFECVVDYIDLNPYFKEEKEYIRTKRMSQIEKFNQRYRK